MKPFLVGFVALLGLSLPLVAQKAVPQPEKPPFDYNLPVSEPRPTPKWVKMIDQGQNDPRLKGYMTPEGVKVEIVADYPTVVNPVGMAFGDDGSLHVLEWLAGKTDPVAATETFTYKDGSKRTVPVMKKPVKDVVKVLRDTKGKGVFDEAKVLLEDELPSSITFHDGWLYLAGKGTVRRYKQSKADGPYDVKEVVAQGFSARGHQQVSGLTVGNDGMLYISTGPDDNYVEGSDGSRATVLRSGAIFRCKPDGSKMQVFSMGYWNPYRDVAFDASFNIFHADNDNGPGKFKGCRLMHVPEESDFGWRQVPGKTFGAPDLERAAVWGELPGKMVPMLKTGPGGPAGLFIYNDTRFPKPFQGLLYYPDVVRKSIRAYKLGPVGATFEVTSEFEFLKSDDPLFRPCQMIVGPDGAMYVCDWRSDLSVAGKLAGDGKNGRIYRMSWAGTPEEAALPLRGLDSWAKIQKQEEGELIKTLSSPEFSDRLRARHELARRGGVKVRETLLDLVDEPKIALPPRIAALGALEGMWSDEVKAEFLSLLHDGEPDIRRLVADGLALNCKPADIEADQELLRVMGDQDLAARRAIVLAMGKIGGTNAAAALLNTFRSNREEDHYLRDALVRALERLGKPGIDQLIELAQSGVEKDFEKVVQAFLTLRTRAAAEAVPTLLAYPHLSIPQRVNLIKAYSNYLLDPPVSLTPVMTYLVKHPDETIEVKMAALEVITMPGQTRTEKERTLPADVIALLGAQPAGAKLVADHYLAKKLPQDLGPQVAEALRKHADKDPELAKLLREVTGK